MRRRSVPAVLAVLVLGSCAGSRVAVDSLEWRLQTSAVGLGLRGLSVVDARTAWASGTDGTFARTIDGNAWEFGRIAEAQGRDLRDVHAFDRDHAIVMAVGEPARFWRTDDGGATWQLVHDDATPGLFFDGIAFADARRGYAFSDPVEGAFVVLRSLDAGRTWQRIDPALLPVPYAGEAGFAASGTNVAARDSRVWFATGGAVARCARSSDFGATWSVAPVPVHHGTASTGVFSIAFAGRDAGVAVGGDHAAPDVATRTAAWTDDGGATWHPAECTGYRSGVAAVPGTRGRVFIAVGPNGTDASDDGGRTWRRAADQGFHAVAFAPYAAIAWAVGADGRIARWDGRPRAR